VGQTSENYRIREVAELVRDVVPGSTVTFAKDGGPDLRCYRVDCSKIRRVLPSFTARWTVARGIEELYHAYREKRLNLSDLQGTRYLRIATIKHRIERGTLDRSLRPRLETASVEPATILTRG
jgi:hypothetical protein